MNSFTKFLLLISLLLGWNLDLQAEETCPFEVRVTDPQTLHSEVVLANTRPIKVAATSVYEINWAGSSTIDSHQWHYYYAFSETPGDRFQNLASTGKCLSTNLQALKDQGGRLPCSPTPLGEPRFFSMTPGASAEIIRLVVAQQALKEYEQLHLETTVRDMLEGEVFGHSKGGPSGRTNPIGVVDMLEGEVFVRSKGGPSGRTNPIGVVRGEIYRPRDSSRSVQPHYFVRMAEKLGKTRGIEYADELSIPFGALGLQKDAKLVYAEEDTLPDLPSDDNNQIVHVKTKGVEQSDEFYIPSGSLGLQQDATLVYAEEDTLPDLPSDNNNQVVSQVASQVASTDTVTTAAIHQVCSYRLVISEEAKPVAMKNLIFLARQADGQEYQRLTEDSTWRSEDLYKILFTPAQKSWVYIFQMDSGGKVSWLFPKESDWTKDGMEVYLGLVNPVQADQNQFVPNERAGFSLDHRTGRERIYFAASTQPDKELEMLVNRLVEQSEQGDFYNLDRAKDQLIQVIKTRGSAGIAFDNAHPIYWNEGKDQFSALERRIDQLCSGCIQTLEFNHQ